MKNLFNLLSKNKYICLNLNASHFKKESRYSLFKNSFYFYSANNMPLLKQTVIDLSTFKNLSTEETLVLHSVFKRHNYQLRIAGGAVRDILLGYDPHDIDFATDATPDEMIAMFESEHIRMLNKNGLSHGTVTARINDKVFWYIFYILKENFEVTTLRIDTDPDGRRCQVQYTTDWEKDANRRDLTINAMFLELNINSIEAGTVKEGIIIDYFNGQEDLNKRLIRFVGSPAERIKEDYLRILRFYRFYGKAIKDNASGLAQISGERIWSEMQRILMFPTSPSILKSMKENLVLKYIGFPSPSEDAFTGLNSLIASNILLHNPNPITMLTLILENIEQLEEVHSHLRLSNNEMRIGYYLLTQREVLSKIGKESEEEQFNYFKKQALLSSEPKSYKVLVINALHAYCQDEEIRTNLIRRWNEWELPRMPVNGRDIGEVWGISGKSVGPILSHLKTIWVESDLKMTKEELLEVKHLDLFKEMGVTQDHAQVKNKKMKWFP